MNHFSRASALYQDGRAKQLIPFTEPQRSDARVKALVHHVALARLAQADQAYERFLRLQVPNDIRFRLRVSLEDASRQNLQGGLYWRAWNDRKTGLLEQARTVYQQVLHLTRAPRRLLRGRTASSREVCGSQTFPRPRAHGVPDWPRCVQLSQTPSLHQRAPDCGNK